VTQPFWDSGVTTGTAIAPLPVAGQPLWAPPLVQPLFLAGNTDCLLPDVSIQNRVDDRWSWDVIYLRSLRVPGLAEVDHGREHRIHKRSAIGNDGTQITSLGYKAADITIKVRLWTPQQLRDFEMITIPSVQPRPGKAQLRPQAVQVEYPSLSMWGISNLFVTKVVGPKKTGTVGVWEVTLTATEVTQLVAVGTTTARGGSIAQQPNVANQPTPASPPSQTNYVLAPTLGQ
jgi:hypothetical protein